MYFFLIITTSIQHEPNTDKDNFIQHGNKTLKYNKLSEGEELRVGTTCGSRFSRYRVMVNSQGVMSGKNASIVSQARAMYFPSCINEWDTQSLRSE